jgi:tetratricopeptide (TPR) repeat protein
VKEQYFVLMWLTYRTGQFERCVEICDAGIDLAAQLGMLPVQYPTIKALALMDLGRYGEAYDSAQQEVSDDNHQFGRANRDMATGIYLSEIMAFDRAEQLLRDSIKQSIALSRAWMVRLEMDSLVRLLIAAGRLNEEALKDVERSLQTMGANLSDDMRSEIALSEGRPDEALQFADKAALNSSDPFGRETPQDVERRDRYFVVAAELKIRVLLALDRPKEALTLADEVMQIARAMNFRAMLWRIHAAMSKGQIMLGNEEASEREEAAAAGVLRQLADSIPDLGLRQGFVSSPLVAPILTEPAEPLPRLTSGDS